MQIYAPDMQIYARNMHEICTKYAKNMQTFAKKCNYMQIICTKYEENMQKYAKNMHLICTLYADICRKYEYAENMQKICRKYAEICT